MPAHCRSSRRRRTFVILLQQLCHFLFFLEEAGNARVTLTVTAGPPTPTEGKEKKQSRGRREETILSSRANERRANERRSEERPRVSQARVNWQPGEYDARSVVGKEGKERAGEAGHATFFSRRVESVTFLTRAQQRVRRGRVNLPSFARAQKV